MTEYYLIGLTTTDNVEYKLNANEWRELENAKLLLDNVFSIEQKYDLLISNYYSFEKELLNQTLEDALRTNGSTTFKLVNLASIIRELHNLIMSIGLFFEQVHSRHLNKLPLNKKSALKINLLMNNLKSDTIELDFIINLRNYSAHRDFPIDSFSLESSWENNKGVNKRLGHCIIPFVSKEKLMRDKKIKKSILKKIQPVNNDKIDIRSPIRKTIATLSKFMQEFRLEINKEAEKSNVVLGNYINKLKLFSSSDNDFCKAFSKEANGKDYYINKDQLKMIEFYSKRNSSLGLLEKRYVHNKI